MSQREVSTQGGGLEGFVQETEGFDRESSQSFGKNQGVGCIGKEDKGDREDMNEADLLEIVHIQQRYGQDTLVLWCSVFVEKKMKKETMK